MKHIILFFALIASTSCSHKDLIKENHVRGECSDNIKHITPPDGQRLIDITKQATAGSASIAIISAGFATDTLFILLTNQVTKITLCIATVALASKSKNSIGTNLCSYLNEKTYDPELTQKAISSTASWRCPNLDYVSVGLREVATCYAAKNEKDKARLQLKNILNDKTISKCISKEEKFRVRNEIALLELQKNK